MTDWTPQTNRIQTMHLTADELAALKAAKHGWEIYDTHALAFRNWPQPSWSPNSIIRAKPAPVTQDAVPWEAIDARFKYAARGSDENRRDDFAACWVFTSLPSHDGRDWDGGEYAQVSDVFAGYVRGTCDWRDSLQQRPVRVGAVTEALKHREKYWLAAPFSQRWAIDVNWTGDGDDMHRLTTGQVYLTKADAIDAAKRMCGKGAV